MGFIFSINPIFFLFKLRNYFYIILTNKNYWFIVERSNGGLARRTYYSDLHGGEVHYSCLKCVVCNIGFDDNDNTSFMAKEMCHRDCFIRLSEMKGEVCFYCNRSFCQFDFFNVNNIAVTSNCTFN